jgi:hypothetical protein
MHSNSLFSELELLSLLNTSIQLQSESPAPRWSCKFVEQQLQSGFGGAGALPNMPLDWFGPPRSNTLRPVWCCRLPELGVFVVGVTSWSGEGVEPKSLEMAFGFSKV